MDFTFCSTQDLVYRCRPDHEEAHHQKTSWVRRNAPRKTTVHGKSILVHWSLAKLTNYSSFDRTTRSISNLEEKNVPHKTTATVFGKLFTAKTEISNTMNISPLLQQIHDIWIFNFKYFIQIKVVLPLFLEIQRNTQIT